LAGVIGVEIEFDPEKPSFLGIAAKLDEAVVGIQLHNSRD